MRLWDTPPLRPADVRAARVGADDPWQTAAVQSWRRRVTEDAWETAASMPRVRPTRATFEEDTRGRARERRNAHKLDEQTAGQVRGCWGCVLLLAALGTLLWALTQGGLWLLRVVWG